MAQTDDVDLKALLCFLTTWQTEQFDSLGWPEEMMDANIVFTLESGRLDKIDSHDQASAQTHPQKGPPQED